MNLKYSSSTFGGRFYNNFDPPQPTHFAVTTCASSSEIKDFKDPLDWSQLRTLIEDIQVNNNTPLAILFHCLWHWIFWCDSIFGGRTCH